MKKIIPLFLYVLLFSNFSVNAKNIMDGNYKNIYMQAENYFVDENYTAALPLYMQLDSIEKGNNNINFKIGLCYLNASTYKAKAIPYLEFAIKNISTRYKQGEISEKQAPLSSYYYLAKAYHLNYEFDKALETYQKYITELGADTKMASEIEDVQHDIETCNYGKELIKKPREVEITNLGDGINTKFPEYSPVVSLDESTLIFTTRRAGGTSDIKLPSGEYYEDIFISTYSEKDEKWGKATSIGANINTKGHEATINLSADGSKLLIYKDDGGNGNIYISELQGQEWGIPKYASAPINSSSWESHACFSSDNRVLYFTSDRAGGYGGRDIYKCLKLPNGDWGPAQNLGSEINTKYDEDGVFIHPDGKQIFFSSKGHNSMGGFDIFSSLINDENQNWSTPINYGYPVNTTDDDVFLITTPNGQRAFFSSDKEGGFGEKDIYMIQFPEFEPRNITILLGKIVNYTKEDISNNNIYIINNITGDTVQDISANSATGKYGTNLPIGNSYKTIYTVNKIEIFSQIIDVPKGKGYQVIKKDVPYGDSTLASSVSNSITNPIATNNTAANNNTSKNCLPGQSSFQLFFKYNKKEIDSESAEFKSFIDNLSQCLSNSSPLAIYIESSASTVPTRTYSSNEKLAMLRASNAKDKLVKALLKNGVKRSQIVFSDTKSLVQGPEYHKDAIENIATYEQYQYIKINTISIK